MLTLGYTFVTCLRLHSSAALYILLPLFSPKNIHAIPRFYLAGGGKEPPERNGSIYHEFVLTLP